MAGRSASAQRPAMVVSDLDGTLLGDQFATDRFRQWWRLHGVSCRLVYATGRHYTSAAASIRDADLPAPDAIVSDVGTEIRLAPFAEPIAEWAENWWGNWSTDSIHHALDALSGLELQPPECQSPYKKSYFAYQATGKLLEQVRRRLVLHGISAEILYSSNRDLDVIPFGANKGAAAAYLATRWRVPRSSVFVAGDSGNDRSLFLKGFRGIVVGNAQPELARLCRPDVYQSEASFADGVIEGLNFWLHRGTQCRGEVVTTGVDEDRPI